jgi:hypothetical protein
MNNDGITEGLQQATSTDAGTAATSVAGAPDPVGQAQGNVQNVQALQGSLNLDPSQVMTNIQLDGNQVSLLSVFFQCALRWLIRNWGVVDASRWTVCFAHEQEQLYQLLRHEEPASDQWRTSKDG